jgi:hypothetical protein
MMRGPAGAGEQRSANGVLGVVVAAGSAVLPPPQPHVVRSPLAPCLHVHTRACARMRARAITIQARARARAHTQVHGYRLATRPFAMRPTALQDAIDTLAAPACLSLYPAPASFPLPPSPACPHTRTRTRLRAGAPSAPLWPWASGCSGRCRPWGASCGRGPRRCAHMHLLFSALR